MMSTLPQDATLTATPVLDEERLAWLALALSPGLGPKRILDAVGQLDAPSQIFTLPLTALEALRFPAEAAQFIFDGKARQAAEQEWARVVEQGATLVTYGCAEYPERLKEIYDPPPVLWVRGDARLLSRPGIAVVGTRHPTPYGSGMAEMLSRDLAVRRLLIISGMARGVDSCAHRGALAARMPTVAVWGTGIRAAELSSPQPHFERVECGRAGGGGGGELRHAGHRPLRRRPEPGSVCRARQRDQQGIVDSQHTD